MNCFYKNQICDYTIQNINGSFTDWSPKFYKDYQFSLSLIGRGQIHSYIKLISPRFPYVKRNERCLVIQFKKKSPKYNIELYQTSDEKIWEKLKNFIFFFFK